MIRKIKVFIISSIIICQSINASGFILKSYDLKGQLSINQVLNGFGCKGNNISPQLSWQHIPKGTKSFAITMYDKNAPTGSGWWHWIVVNIDNKINYIKKGASNTNSMPTNSIQSKNDFGKNSFDGVCPPVDDGYHEYITTIYAIDIDKLPITNKTQPAMAGFIINSYTISKSSIVTYYKR